MYIKRCQAIWDKFWAQNGKPRFTVHPNLPCYFPFPERHGKSGFYCILNGLFQKYTRVSLELNGISQKYTHVTLDLNELSQKYTRVRPFF